MDDSNKAEGFKQKASPGTEARPRARTVVIRGWQEKCRNGSVLRGTVRDLSHGRSRGFEGLSALNEILRNIFEDGDTAFLPESRE